MESLPPSDIRNPEKKVSRKWRKNTEVKIARSVSETNEGGAEPSHEKLWHQVIGTVPGDRMTEASSASTEQQNDQRPSEIYRRRPTEAHNIHGGIQPERIGHVLINAAEQLHPNGTQSVETDTGRLETIASHVATISREDLLELSGKIVIDGSSLLQVYETHLIGEQALRRIITEHLSGGNVKEALRQELVEHEIDFERDPIMRDRPHQAITTPSKTLDDLLRDAHVDADDDSNQVVRAGRQTTKDHSKASNRSLRDTKRNLVIDALLFGVIAILLIFVIYLLLTR